MSKKHVLRSAFALLPIIVIIFLSIFSIVVFYPGLFSADSYSSFEQFQHKTYTDWQPVIFILPWVLFPFKGAVFLQNILLIYLGISIIFLNNIYRGNWLYNYPLLFFILNPTVFITLCHVWKDITMIGCLIFAIALLVSYRYFIKQYIKICIQLLYFILLVYATLVRGNSVFATIPLLMYGFYYFYLNSFQIKSTTKVVFSAVMTLMLILVIIIINSYVVYSVLNTTKNYPQSYMMLNDMANIECLTNRSDEIIPNQLFINPKSPNREEMCQIASTWVGTGNGFYWSKTPSFYQFPLDSNYTIIKSKWLKSIQNHALIYTKYRLKAFFVDFNTNNGWFVSAYVGKYSKFFGSMCTLFNVNKLFILYLSYCAIILNVLILCYSIYLKKGILLTVQISGFLYFVTWIPLLPGTDARYFLYSYLVGFIGLCLIKLKGEK